MNSLKRLLNDNEVDIQSNPPPLLGHYSDNSFSETPLLSDGSWTNVYGDLGLLDPSSDSTDDSPFSSNGSSEAFDSQTIEQGIESWVSQEFPEEDESSQPEETMPCTPNNEVESENTGKICYGMIYRTSVKLNGDMLSIDAKLKPSGRRRNQAQQLLQLKKDERGVFLTFPDGTEFGLLNSLASKALEDIITWPTIETDGFVEIRPLRETLGRATKPADAKTRVNITMYGAPDAKERLGNKLSKEKLFLQKPDSRRHGTTYDNPHIITFPNFQITNQELQQEETQDGAASSNSVLQFEKTISQVYASLTRCTNLQRIEGDGRLKTKLLEHQEQGLDFMLQREDGPIQPEFSLWKPLAGEDEGWFCHAVTRAKSRIQHTETGGGILADEMGMGKTLSILALVTKTLETAHEWASDNNADEVDSLPAKKRTSATLVIVPSALLINTWEDEVQKHLDGTLKKLRYHGLRRKDCAPEFEQVDIVVTTYHTLVADFKDKKSPLHKVEWFRIVLDEAHIIRRQATTFNRAVTELSARSRWCLTGTPIQNRLADIGALFAFIKACPFDSLATFKRYISIPFEESPERRATACRSLALLLDSICLRRTKDLLHLPDRVDRLRELEFTEDERNQYEQTKSTMNRALRQRVGESFVKSRFGMFQVQLQLRILCNHGTFQHPFSWARRSLMDEREDALCTIGNNREVRCSACRQCMPVLESNNFYRIDNANCGHNICVECLGDGIEQTNGSSNPAGRCPLCLPGGSLNIMGKLRNKMINGGSHDESYFQPNGHSSKMDALMADVRQDLDTTKSIIFSSWTNTLNLVGRYLDKESIPFYRIDGECALPIRQKILDDFATSKDKPVLIMTTGTGAFGLNLTSANRVFIVEPQWNPSVENQAIARAQRLGQGQSVLVTRYKMKRTVEEEMRKQQEHKLSIAELGNATQSQNHLIQTIDETMEDV